MELHGKFVALFRPISSLTFHVRQKFIGLSADGNQAHSEEAQLSALQTQKYNVKNRSGSVRFASDNVVALDYGCNTQAVITVSRSFFYPDYFADRPHKNICTLRYLCWQS